jgi:methyltransferase (TIGR00027 family)
MALASRTSPGVEVFLFARTAVPDDLIRDALTDNQETQVVILGAGLDTSGLRIGAERRRAGLQPGVFFEVDLPTMQTEKRRQVDRLLLGRPSLRQDHIVYVSCSFGEHELGTVLREAGLQLSKPTVWVWSGVVHYLTEEAVRSTVAELKTLSAPGSQLFFDFILLEAYQDPDKYGFRKTKARFDAFGEVMSFGFHEGREHVSQWLREQGLEFARCYTHVDMVQLYEAKTGKRAPSGGTPWSSLCVARFQAKPAAEQGDGADERRPGRD